LFFSLVLGGRLNSVHLGKLMTTGISLASRSYDRCIVCGSQRLKNLGTPPLQLDKKSGSKVLECSACALQWADPMPTGEELDEFYAGAQDYANQNPYEGLSGLFRQKVFHPYRGATIVRLVNRFAPTGTILDYGCGHGRLLQCLRAAGRSAVGIDYSARLTEHLRQQGYDARQATSIKHTGLPPHSLQCIVASHVIEHLVDPLEFLNDAGKLLAPDGVLIAAVPSRTSLRARLKTSGWHFVDPPNHLWGFTPENLRGLLERAGWSCLYVRNELAVNEVIGVSHLQ
jgi:2-polyprenyl-3-methyl-5-hydroxy-6-metoxy-1,4-benzoquinol methylase